MIRIDLIRQKAAIHTNALTKTQKAMKQQIIHGIKSSPFAEEQSISIKIDDHPLQRFFMNFFDIDEELVKADLTVDFTRAYMENGKLAAKKYQFQDTFGANQLTELKEGKNLLTNKDSFISKLVKKINKAIKD